MFGLIAQRTDGRDTDRWFALSGSGAGFLLVAACSARLPAAPPERDAIDGLTERLLATDYEVPLNLQPPVEGRRSEVRVMGR